MALNVESVSNAACITADGIIGSSGAETVIWAIETSGVSALIYDGTTTTTLKWALASGGSVSFPKGIHCPNGVYVDLTGSGHVSVSYTQ